MAYGLPVIGTDSTPVGATKVNNSIAAVKATTDDHETRIDDLEAGGDTTPDASTTVKGKVELATNAETVTGTDTARATTPAGVAAAIAASGGGGGGAVDSVNGDSGPDVVLTQDDIADGTTAKQYTATEKTKLGTVATGADVSYGWKPSDNALLAATFAPQFIYTGAILTTGAYYPMRVHIPAGATITNVLLYITIAGSGLTTGEVAVYEQSGTKVGVSAAQTTAWQSTGLKTVALGTPVASQTSDRDVWVSVLIAGTTGPTLGAVSNLSNLGIASGRLNAGYLFGSAPHPSTLTLTSMVSYARFWIGIS